MIKKEKTPNPPCKEELGESDTLLNSISNLLYGNKIGISTLKANAVAPNNNKGAVAHNGKSAIQKAANQPSQESIVDSNQNPSDLVFDKLLFDMEENIEAYPDEIIADGSIHRFDVDTVGDKKGWYAAHFTEEMSYAFYGDWSEGQTYQWHSLKDTVVALGQIKKLKSARLEAQKKCNEARALEQSEAAKNCMELWDELVDASDDHPYLKNKGVKPYGIRLHPSYNNLIIPVLNRGGISSLQSIKESGKKSFFPNGKMSEGYHLIGSFGPLVLICEGYATGASLHEATGYPTVVAFNAGNLPKVAKELKKEHPDADFIICADNDKWTSGNPGRTKAKEAAKVCSGIVAYPKFKQPEIDKHGKPTDWNDYHQLYGLSAVLKALQPKINKVKRNHSLFSDITELTKNISAPDYLVDEFIELDTIGAIIGASSVGKSFVGISIAASVATGTMFAEKAVQQGAVLYLAGEGVKGISRRFSGWMQHTGIQIPKGSIHVSNKTIYMDAEGASTLLAATEDMDQDIKLVVIDTLARHMTGEENSNKEMSAFIALVDTIREEHGCAVLIIHHTGHSSDKSNRARGASAFYASLDFEFLMKGNKKGTGTIEGTKNKEDTRYPKRGFSLVPIELDGITNTKGGPVTTVVVEWNDFCEELSDADKVFEPSKAYLNLKNALIEHDDYNGISVKNWRDFSYRNSSCINQNSKRSEFHRHRVELVNSDVIEINGDYCKVLDPELLKLGDLEETSEEDLETG
jgi:putative DNA primase/helicase